MSSSKKAADQRIVIAAKVQTADRQHTRGERPISSYKTEGRSTGSSAGVLAEAHDKRSGALRLQ
jgi:hypothetical protein